MAEQVLHVSLDFWHTLASPNRLYSGARNRLLSNRYKVNLEQAEQGYKTLKDHWEREAVATGRVPCGETLRQEFNRCFNGMLNPEQFGQLRAEMRAAFAALPPHIDRAALEQVYNLMRQGVNASITSNTNFLIGGASLELLLPDLFTFRLWSDKLGVCKPNPQMFALVAEHSGVLPKNILHVGDSAHCDYEPALRAGMQAALCSSQNPTAEILRNLVKEAAHAG